MGHRVIGIELEGGTLRAAVVETRLRRFELTAVIEMPLHEQPADPSWAREQPQEEVQEPAAAPVRVREALERSLAEPFTPADSFAVAFPGTEAFVRRLSFPFKDQNRIAATLPFQLIGQIPVQPQDIHCAFERVAVEAGQTEVLAVAVPKERFRAFLDEARGMGVEPSHVSVDGVCLAAWLPFLPNPPDAPVLLIHVRRDRADMLVARGPRVELVRCVALGEPVVQDAAENAPAEAGRKEVSAAFLREVLVTSAGASEAGIVIGSVLVSGEQADALAAPLNDVLKLPCEVLDPSRLPLPTGAVCSRLNPATARVVALALAAASGTGPGRLNLLTGEFQKEGAYSLLREKARFFLAVSLLFVLLGAARFAGRVAGLHAERAMVVEELKALTTEVLGAAKEDPAAAIKAMKATLEEDVSIFPKWTAVDTLGRLLSAVKAMGPSSSAAAEAAPPDEAPPEPRAEKPAATASARPLTPTDTAAVEVENIRIEPKLLSVRGEADTIETLDGLVARLKTDPCFREVTTESTERIQFRRHQGWQRFSLRVEVDCGGTAQKPRATAPAANGRDGTAASAAAGHLAGSPPAASGRGSSGVSK